MSSSIFFKWFAVGFFAIVCAVVVISQTEITRAEIDINSSLSIHNDFDKIGLVAGTTVSPSVRVAFPAASATVTQIVTVEAAADDNIGALGMQFAIDGSSVGAELLKRPFNYAWDTTAVANGSHSISVVARDAAGALWSSAPITVMVNNPEPLTIKDAGVVSVGSTSAVLAFSTTRASTASVSYGKNYSYAFTVSPKIKRTTSHRLTLANLASETLFAIRIQAIDASYNLAYNTSLTFTTATAPDWSGSPSGYITAPKTGSKVTGSVPLSASASPASLPSGGKEGNNAITGVQYQVDGFDIGSEISAAPYNAIFDSSIVENGTHNISAVLRDAAGHTTATAPVSVNVQNGEFSQVTTPVAADSSTARLVNAGGTFYLIAGGLRYGITDPGVLGSYGFEFKDGTAAAGSDIAMPLAPRLAPGDGSLVKKAGDATVWFVSGAQKYGFTSSEVFLGQGFAWKNVREVAAEVLDPLPKAGNLTDGAARHQTGVYVSYNSTIYKMGANGRLGIPSTEVYNSWNVDNDYSQVVPANTADLAAPLAGNLTARSLN